MFGESESESPRLPSPWDTLSHHRLVPEAEEGNVEYKLQLLSPSPARFARLVTQMKWRLLEGGGQAYYELGVSDTGALVGLPRADLDHSLHTLDRMAGEIGASVIVVKEIEVPPIIPLDENGDDSTTDTTDIDDEPSSQHHPTSLDTDPSDLDNTDLEIASVFKPRPSHSIPTNNHVQTKQEAKISHRRNGRHHKHDRKRRAALLAQALSKSRDNLLHPHENPPITIPESSVPQDLASSLSSLHLSTTDPPSDPLPPIDLDLKHTPSHPTRTPSAEPRLIVEALVVRKLSLEEAFLDFGGFSLL